MSNETEKQLTAVEWLWKQIPNETEFWPKEGNDILQQALEMEKEQMIRFYLRGGFDSFGSENPLPTEADRESAEKYYSEKFGK